MSKRSKVFKEKLHPKKPLRELFIRADIAELVIEPHDEDYLDLSGMILGGDASDVAVEHDEVNGRISINIWSKSEYKIFDIKVKLRIPVQYKLSLLTVSLDTGDIRVDGLPVGKIYLYTANGDIMAGGVSGEEMKLESINGDLYIRGGEITKLDISSTNGDIRIETHIEKATIKTNNINGEIRLLITEESDADIQASTVNGKIRVYNKDKFSELSEDKQYLKGKLGEGESEVLLNTVNGDIKIEILETISRE
jgi:DUF4097 and DUF4098 domain-containing protein YvlB